jgi:hypothetical protein
VVVKILDKVESASQTEYPLSKAGLLKTKKGQVFLQATWRETVGKTAWCRRKVAKPCEGF